VTQALVPRQKLQTWQAASGSDANSASKAPIKKGRFRILDVKEKVTDVKENPAAPTAAPPTAKSEVTSYADAAKSGTCTSVAESSAIKRCFQQTSLCCSYSHIVISKLCTSSRQCNDKHGQCKSADSTIDFLLRFPCNLGEWCHLWNIMSMFL
jgi:hypothetical protein